jgi:hypothetical protein
VGKASRGGASGKSVINRKGNKNSTYDYATDGVTDGNDDFVFSMAAMGAAKYSREERNIVNALGALKACDAALYKAVRDGVELRSEGDQKAMIQKMSSHALKLRLKENIKENAVERKNRVDRGAEELIACIMILATFVNGESLQLSYSSVQALRHMVKAYENLVDGAANDEHKEGVRVALFTAVPELLKRMSARKTPKEMKRMVCKTLLTAARSEKVDGLNVVVPFLNSPKFVLVSRLFVLKLLTKEFGLEDKRSPLSFPMVVTVGLAALDNDEQKVDEKVLRAATALLVAVSLAPGGGAVRVEKYFKIKKVAERTQGMLKTKMEEGFRAKREKEESRRRKAAELKELAKFDAISGVEGMLDRVAREGDFRKQSTYLTYNEDEDDELHSDDDDAVAHDSDEEKEHKKKEAVTKDEKENRRAAAEEEQKGQSEKKESKSLFSFALPGKPRALQSTEVLLEQLMDSLINEEKEGEEGGKGKEVELNLEELDSVMDELLG